MCRRQGEKLFLKGERCSSAKCAILKRNFPPGAHGAKGSGRMSGYGLQLREKQKAKRLYGLMEAQFRKYYESANKAKGNSGEIMVRLLETRFDNVIFRLGFAKSRAMARQMVSHGMFNINGHKNNIPSNSVKPNDIITIDSYKTSKKIFESLREQLKKHEAPSWLLVDSEKLEGKVLSYPEGEELKQPFDPKFIIEFYSR